MAELELKEYLASDESESDGDNNEDEVEDKSEKKRDKYRALIQAGDSSDEDEEDDNGHGGDMEVTFSSGLEEISKRISEKKNKKTETVWEAYLRKRKEKKNASKKGSKYASDDESSDADEEPAEEADDFFVEDTPAEENMGSGETRKRADENGASRAELELLTADDTNLKGYNIKPKKRKGKRGREIIDEGKIPTVDNQDPRFSALFTSPLYAPDPTDPQYKRCFCCFILCSGYCHPRNNHLYMLTKVLFWWYRSASYQRQKLSKSTRKRNL